MNRLSLDRSLYPIEAFFNRLTLDELYLAMERFATGQGYNPEDLNCFFPADLAEDEPGPEDSFGYIEFWAYATDQTVQVAFDDFLSYLRQAIEAQVLARSSERARLEAAYGIVAAKVSELDAAHRWFLRSGGQPPNQ